MKCKRKFMHGKRLRRSPIKKGWDFSKTPDYSGKGTFGEALGKSLVPNIHKDNTATQNIKEIASLVPLGKASKLVGYGKSIYDYFTS